MNKKACKDCKSALKAPGRSRCWHCYSMYRKAATRVELAPSNMKILYIDIETTPNIGQVWDLWNQNISLKQLVDVTEMFCFAYKWSWQDEVTFVKDSGQNMAIRAWNLLDEADVVVHYYGSKFDIPHLNREWALRGFPPPRPFKQVDLKNAVAKRFKFPSNKLQHVSEAFGLIGKVDHEGQELWIKCMAGVPEAWKKMEEYNKQDVVLLEELYEILLPWLPDHPHRWLYDGEGGCPRCGADGQHLEDVGYAYTKLSKFDQYQCSNCNSFFRGSKRISGVSLQDSVL